MENKYILLDGAVGTCLAKLGLEPGKKGEFFNIEAPEKVIQVHRDYVEAGSQIIYANTFGISPLALEGQKYSTEDLIVAGVRNAKVARGDREVKIALALGSLGHMMEPMGSLSFERAYEEYRVQVQIGAREGVDLVVLETITDLGELRAAILAVKETTNLPLITTMSFEKNGRTFNGCLPESFALTATSLGVDALGVNCSLGPFEIYPIIERIARVSPLPLVVKANAGLPDIEGKYTMDSQRFVQGMERILDLGVQYIGGCCGTDPSYIRGLGQVIKGRTPKKRDFKIRPAICSPQKYIPLEGFIGVGERINPTGRPDLMEDLEKGETRALVKEALLQAQGPCQVLDLNLGGPGLDEEALMPKAVRDIQALVDLGLQIDSSRPEVIEAGLRAYNGKAIVNSTTGEEAKMEAIFPLVKKYGAAIIGLCLDEGGIPPDGQGRLQVARKILKKAQDYGIPKEDIIIDPLALTLASQEDSALVALETIDLIKEELGLRTILGISNISFGLPHRDLVNSAFLGQALDRGLDMAILNPLSPRIGETLLVADLLGARDPQGKKFISQLGQASKEEARPHRELSLDYALAMGLGQDLVGLVEDLLGEKSELDIIDQDLIPALDKLGLKYEKGEIFLPQLIKGASTASLAFDRLKASIRSKGQEGIKKGDIVLATVKGDIHDIGKNIGRLILENYGYNVYDLGKDVDPREVLKKVREKKIRLVGLSALMTTSLPPMEETIRILKEYDPGIKIMVGGAVLTEAYAKKVGADYYLGDARDNAKVAREVLD